MPNTVQTDSARASLQSFYCTLCSKGYARHPDYLSHLSSYDHSHKARLKDMKAMSKDPAAAAKARKAESKEDGVVRVKLGGVGAGKEGGVSGSGFKKGGFRNAFGGGEEVKGVGKGVFGDEDENEERMVVVKTEDSGELDGDGESGTDEEDYYDPKRPTGCWEGCAGC